MNLKKLLNSKWTAANPKESQKHFIVPKVEINSKDSQIVDFICLKQSPPKQSIKSGPMNFKIEGYGFKAGNESVLT